MDQFLDQGLTAHGPKEKSFFQKAVRLIYPPLCLACRAETAAEHGLCGACWAETHFISAASCDACGQPLPGQDPDEPLLCDGCTARPPAWRRGRAAVVYEGAGRRAALALKHGDRLDIAGPVAHWMARSGAEILHSSDLLIPVPLHWARFLKRKYNQSSVLSRQISRITDVPTCPDALIRTKPTVMQKGMSRDARFENQANAIAVNPKRAGLFAGKTITLIDDVLTTGATLSACAEICRAQGAACVDILVLARVARDV